MNDQTIVWIAGTGWDAVPGTDKRLVEAISKDHHVTWIDPPVPVRHVKELGELAAAGRHPEMVSRNVLRVRVPALPGVTRPGIRGITHVLLGRAIRQALHVSARQPSDVVVAFPLARFPVSIDGRRTLYVTDDWVAGSTLMGFSRAAVEKVLASNLYRAHNVATVSAQIGRTLSHLESTSKTPAPSLRRAFKIIPNGGPPHVADIPAARNATAGLVGQLNERLDLESLEAVADTGIQIEVIGPRAERDPVFRARMDTFLSSKNVTWHGPLLPSELIMRMTTFGVGLTPYAETAFNQASFPLKTLEYLSAGIAVVSTDMPAAHWLNTPHVAIGKTPQDFARCVVQALGQRNDKDASFERCEFSKSHTWDARAIDFLKLVSDAGGKHIETGRKI